MSVQPILAYDLVILRQAMYATPENIAKIRLISDSEIDKHSSLTAFKVRIFHIKILFYVLLQYILILHVLFRRQNF